MFKKLQKVYYVGTSHENFPQYFPPIGHVGKIVEVGEGVKEGMYLVAWEKNSGTQFPSIWYCEEFELSGFDKRN